jgi:hypothetical protein
LASVEITHRVVYKNWIDFLKYPAAGDGSDLIRMQGVLDPGATGADLLEAICKAFKIMGSENGRGLEIEISPKLGDVLDVYAKEHGYQWDGEGPARNSQIRKAPLTISEDLYLREFDELKWRVTRVSLLETSRVMNRIKFEGTNA